MFPRMGTYYLTHRVDPAQGAESSPRRNNATTGTQLSSDPNELGMLLRLGVLIAAGVGMAMLLTWMFA